MRDDDGFANIAEQAYHFSCSLTAGLNLCTVLMHSLVAKGILDKRGAQDIVSAAAEASAQAPLPEAHAKTVAEVFERIRAGFDEY